MVAVTGLIFRPCHGAKSYPNTHTHLRFNKIEATSYLWVKTQPIIAPTILEICQGNRNTNSLP